MRAQATGAIAIATPRGLALLRQCGLAAWIAGFPIAPASAAPQTASGPLIAPVPSAAAELVRVLASMALAVCGAERSAA